MVKSQSLFDPQITIISSELGPERPDSLALEVPVEAADLVEQGLERRALLSRQTATKLLQQLVRRRPPVHLALERHEVADVSQHLET